MDVYTFDKEQFEDIMTQTKNTFVTYLFDQGYISREQYEHLHMNTAIVARKIGFFSHLWTKFVPSKDLNNTYLMVVEQKTFFKEDYIETDESNEKVYHLRSVKKKNEEEPKDG